VTGAIDRADGIGPAEQGIAPGEFEEVIRAMGAGVRSADRSNEDRGRGPRTSGGRAKAPPPQS
jgi:hypothetical protein